jgi:hypothetical protein
MAKWWELHVRRKRWHRILAILTSIKVHAQVMGGHISLGRSELFGGSRESRTMLVSGDTISGYVDHGVEQ